MSCHWFIRDDTDACLDECTTGEQQPAASRYQTRPEWSAGEHALEAHISSRVDDSTPTNTLPVDLEA